MRSSVLIELWRPINAADAVGIGEIPRNANIPTNKIPSGLVSLESQASTYPFQGPIGTITASHSVSARNFTYSR